MKILFVCTGNTCRSPMTEGIFKHLLKEKNIEGINVSSAGISVFPGEPANEKAIAILKDKGIDITKHKARQLSDEIMSADIILTMTSNHKKFIEYYFKADETFPCHKPDETSPCLTPKVFTLKEFSSKVSKEKLINSDIDDPYGKNYDEYKRVSDEIEKELFKIINNIHRLEELWE